MKLFEHLPDLSFTAYSYPDNAMDQLQVFDDGLRMSSTWKNNYYAPSCLKDPGFNHVYLHNMEALGSLPLFALPPLHFWQGTIAPFF